MKIPMSVLVPSKDALIRLSQQPLLPADAFRLSHILSTVGSAIQRFESLQFPLCQKYGVSSSDGTLYSFPDPVKRIKFQEELNPLLKEEIEVDIRYILIASLEKVDIRMSASDLLLLDWLLKEKEEPIVPTNSG